MVSGVLEIRCKKDIQDGYKRMQDMTPLRREPYLGWRALKRVKKRSHIEAVIVLFQPLGIIMVGIFFMPWAEKKAQGMHFRLHFFELVGHKRLWHCSNSFWSGGTFYLGLGYMGIYKFNFKAMNSVDGFLGKYYCGTWTFLKICWVGCWNAWVVKGRGNNLFVSWYSYMRWFTVWWLDKLD